ncbi:hypothetical protein KR018_002931 [Drosophila ironensis]|nr:hypothetical protein KR018_002931 [Drosophila ironensis]
MYLSFWIGWFLIFTNGCTAQRKFRIVIDEVNIKSFDMDTLRKFECQVFQTNNRSYVDCQIIINRNIDKFMARTALELSKPNGQAMKIFDAQLDACLFMKSTHKNKFFSIYKKALQKYSNLQCPLKANFLYKLEKLSLNEQDFPSFIPFGKFRSVTDFYINQSRISIRVVVRGKIVPWQEG